MDSTQTAARQHADITFMVVLSGTNYAPLLVQRRRFISKVGHAAARKTYQTAYAPKEFPAAISVRSEGP